MTNLFKEAHILAKAIKAEFPEVNYKFQFALCVKYLKSAAVKTVELTGSEKQVKWAMDIRAQLLNSFDGQTMASVIAPIICTGNTPKKAEFIANLQTNLTNDTEGNNNMIVNMLKDIILNETKAVTFINNKSIGLFLSNYFNN
jgi:hypothetical protein